MLDNGYGKIIFTASLLTFQGGITVPGYAASKGGIGQLTKALANEWAGKGVNVNAIAPGFFLTDQNRSLLTNPDGSMTPRGQTIVDHTPMRRYGDPKDLLGALLWLVNDRGAGFVTGAVIPVDGGFNAFSGV